MSGILFSDAILYGFLFSGAIFGFLSAAFWIEDKINDQDEHIEELFSRLEEKAENHELKK